MMAEGGKKRKSGEFIQYWLLVKDLSSEEIHSLYGNMRPQRYIAEALQPINNFRRYKAFNNGAIREFYLLLRMSR
jgi:hypothetical protein